MSESAITSKGQTTLHKPVREALLARDRTNSAGPELAPSTDEGRRTGSGEMAPQ